MTVGFGLGDTKDSPTGLDAFGFRDRLRWLLDGPFERGDEPRVAGLRADLGDSLVDAFGEVVGDAEFDGFRHVPENSTSQSASTRTRIKA